VAGGLAHEPKVPQQDKQGADGYRRAYDLVGQFPFLHQKVSVRQPVLRNLEAIRAGDAKESLAPMVFGDTRARGSLGSIIVGGSNRRITL